jgi:hypothetical protein
MYVLLWYVFTSLLRLCPEAIGQKFNILVSYLFCIPWYPTEAKIVFFVHHTSWPEMVWKNSSEFVRSKYHRDMTPCRLVELGAVRLQMQTNPRKRKGGTNSDCLIDSGAVRLTCHTTPRRLYAIRGKIWSPPPSSLFKRMAP